MRQNLYLVRGLPGSGKSTFCNRKFPGMLHLENDQFLMRDGRYTFTPELRNAAIDWCRKSAMVAMRSGMDVCVSNTFVKNCHMDDFFRMAKYYKYDVSVFRMISSFNSAHSVPLDVIEKMSADFEKMVGEKYVDVDKTSGEYVFFDFMF